MPSSKKRARSVIGRMLHYAVPHWHWFVLSIVLAWFIVIMEALYVWIPASLVQTLFAPESAPPPEVPFSIHTLNAYLKYRTYQLQAASDPYRSLKIICAIMLVTAVLKNVAMYVHDLVVTRLKLGMVRDIRDQLYRHVTRLPFTFFDRSRSGNVVAKVLNDVNVINISVLETLNAVLLEPLRVVAFLGLMIVISPKMTLIVLAVYPLLVYGIVRIGQSVRRRSRRMLNDLSGLVSVLNETVMGMRLVKTFNRDRREVEKFEKENRTYTRAAFRAAKVRELAKPTTDTLGGLMAVVLLLIGGRMVLDPDKAFAAEDFMRFLFLLLSMYRPIKVLAKSNMSLQTGLAAAQRVFETMDEEPETLHPFRPEAVPTFESALAFEQVTFHYPGHAERVLDAVSFTAPKGSTVALVGPSGSGKSTIMDLIPRFYDVTEGCIRLDGLDVGTFDLAGYRHLFGIVSQDTILFNDTVRNNIAYGVDAADEAAIVEAARRANALEFIEALPHGLDTEVGERGVNLSGGQRQRIAIARALLKDPPILLLDEATSALDTESEREVQRAIMALMRHRTTLVVAHRLSTVQHADRILVLKGGRIVEEGRHDELMALNGVYRRYHAMQFDVPAEGAAG